MKWVLYKEASPAKHFTALEPQNPEISQVYVVQKRCLTDLEALILWNVRSRDKLPDRIIFFYKKNFLLMKFYVFEIVICKSFCRVGKSNRKMEWNESWCVHKVFLKSLVASFGWFVFVCPLDGCGHPPDLTFNSFRASKSVYQLVLFSSETWINGLWSSNNVMCSVRL